AQQQAEPPVVDAAVVGDHREGAGSLLQQRLKQLDGVAGESEAADGEGGAVGDVGHGLGRGGDRLVHAHGGVLLGPIVLVVSGERCSSGDRPARRRDRGDVLVRGRRPRGEAGGLCAQGTARGRVSHRGRVATGGLPPKYIGRLVSVTLVVA